MLISRNFALNRRFGHFSGNGSSRRIKALPKLNKIDAFLWPLFRLELTPTTKMRNQKPVQIPLRFLALVYFSMCIKAGAQLKLPGGVKFHLFLLGFQL
jgi:hypothetical protein